VKAFDAAKMCGLPGPRCTAVPPTCNHAEGDHHCRMPKGWGTSHVGAGSCKAHFGSTPNGKKHAAKEAAERAIAKLGLPVGTGDPMVLLTKTVQHAEGYLEATGEVLTAMAGADAADDGFGVEAAAELYAAAIRSAARVGKAAVDADVADRLAALDERAGELLMRFVGELLERVVPAKQRPAVTAWARDRLVELAAEYERPGSVH
jgi:hypothetical protein